MWPAVVDGEADVAVAVVVVAVAAAPVVGLFLPMVMEAVVIALVGKH